MDTDKTEVRTPAPNSTYKKLAVQYSAETFVVNQNSVLRINICGENRQLLVAANRWVQGAKNFRGQYATEDKTCFRGQLTVD